jgi:hypothetical protein
MKTLTISRRIYIIVLIMSVMMAVIGGFAIQRLIVLRDHTDQIVGKSMPGVILAARINGRQSEN